MKVLIQRSALTMLVMGMSLLSGCSGERVDLIDLNKVLDVFVSTMDQFSAVGVDGYSATEADDSLASGEEKREQLNQFVNQYETNLNKEKMMSHNIGVNLLDDGSMEGYADRDNSSSKGSGEEKLFTIEIDSERDRLIATDTQNGYHRDSNFVASMVGGMLAGYMLSSMLSRQKASGGGRSSRFGNMKMSPKNYHASAAQAKAKSSSAKSSSSSSARSRSGSGSYSSGK